MKIIIKLSNYQIIFVFLPVIIYAFNAKAYTETDSLLIFNSNSNRIGINSFAFQNSLLGRISLGEVQKISYHFSNDWEYYEALHRYVKQDNIANLHHLFLLKNNIALIQKFNVTDFAANNVRIIDISSNLKISKQIDSTHFFINQLKLGFLSDQRTNINDVGPVYGINIQYLYTNPNKSFNSGLNLFYDRAEIYPRRNRVARISGTLSKIFNPYAYLRLNLGYTSRLKEDYFLNNIQQIVSDTITSQLDLRYQIAPFLILKSNNTIKLPSRYFNYRANPLIDNPSIKQSIFYNQSNVELSQKIIYTDTHQSRVPGSVLGRGLSSSLELIYKQRNRIYGLENNLELDTIKFQEAVEKEKIKDIIETTTTWKYSLDYHFNEVHMISLNTISQLFRVDTESEKNDQDKDELFYSGEIAYNTQWNKLFRTYLIVSGGFKHMVFIKPGQSAENYKDRILGYEPGFKWTAGKFSWNGDYSLRAIYQVRDFAIQQKKNRSNRIFKMTHLMNYNLTNSTSIELEFLRRENRIGWLNWEAFTESPIDTTINYDISLSVKKVIFPANKNNTCAVELGYRYFDQNKRNLAGLNTNDTLIPSGKLLIYLRHITLQHGPEVKFYFNDKKKLNIEFDLWLQFVRTFFDYKTTNKSYEEQGQPFDQKDLEDNKKKWFWDFLPYHNIYPYFTIKLNYNLQGRKNSK
ncbi:MAG: hypothetical protein IIA88_05535 [Bacteroidetes bacterium]|nr:hypothetical protein [Bacteroidota bacterium]